MRTVALLIALLFVLASAEYVEFGEKAINEIFKEHRDAFIIFTSPENSDSVEKFKESAAADSLNVHTIVDKEQNKEHFQRFAEYLGLTIQSTPTLIFFAQGKTKYLGDASDLSSQGLSSFAAKIAAGEIKPFLKSAPIPIDDKEAVKTIVGKNFKEAVLDSEKEVLLKIYAPWCGHCKTIAPHFKAAAEQLAWNKNIVLGEFDGTLNEVEGMQIQGYPTLLWYGKDKSVEPVKFNGGREKDGIVDWIKDHTEYEWNQPVEEVEEQPEEEL